MILAFDTATEATTVALCEPPSLELELHDHPPTGQRPRHTTRLMPFVVEILSTASVGWEAIDRIAVGVGPGTFTGLRIGIATARALALARGLPLSGVSTLHSLALEAARVAPGDDDRAILAAIDARRGEVFAAAWRGSTELLAPQALSPERLAATLGDLREPAVAVGTGAVKFREVLVRAGASVPEPDSELHQVTAISHCRLARDLPARHPDDVHPEYLRLPDAEIASHSSGSP
ncbi:MAG: tRNA (adenosine(37)-N6)-threonylcarbamoyltransferase complex dimerization subunit type 1 TsaB [Solirubrobacterales bacterium]|nr:tRNA (adenosine(37)-N6)-threonylcarbamoyltransferase complex dimerization subunit type 1 TsaB [Solirubrobacterales bacterium]